MNNISRQRIGFVLREAESSGTGNDRGGINGEIGKAKMGEEGRGRDREEEGDRRGSLFPVSKRALNGHRVKKILDTESWQSFFTGIMFETRGVVRSIPLNDAHAGLPLIRADLPRAAIPLDSLAIASSPGLAGFPSYRFPESLKFDFPSLH